MNAEALNLVLICFLVTLVILISLFDFINTYEALLPIKLAIHICLILSIILFILFYYVPMELKTNVYFFFGFPKLLIGLQKLIIFIISPENRLIIEIYRWVGVLLGINTVISFYRKTKEDFKKLKYEFKDYKNK